MGREVGFALQAELDSTGHGRRKWAVRLRRSTLFLGATAILLMCLCPHYEADYSTVPAGNGSYSSVREVVSERLGIAKYANYHDRIWFYWEQRPWYVKVDLARNGIEIFGVVIMTATLWFLLGGRKDA